MKVWKVTFHEKEADEDSTAWSSDNIPADDLGKAHAIALKALKQSKLKLKITKIEFLCYVSIEEE